MFLFLLLVGGIAYLIIRHFDRAQMHPHTHTSSTTSATSNDDPAYKILRTRLATGEITEEEFASRMNLLKEHQHSS